MRLSEAQSTRSEQSDYDRMFAVLEVVAGAAIDFVPLFFNRFYSTPGIAAHRTSDPWA